MCRWDITGNSDMKKLFVVLFAAITCLSLSSFTIDDRDRGMIVVKEAGGDYIHLTDVKGWTSATEYNTYSIYYKEGNGERVYYIEIYSYYEIHDNHYYNSPVCNDFRRNYRYVSCGCYFNCNLPGRGEEIIDGYRFYTQVQGWNNTTDSEIYNIFYKEGNGKRVYYIEIYSYYKIQNNDLFNSPTCGDFRKNYRYVSNGTYFNCNLSGR